MVFFSSSKLYTIVEDGTVARELSANLRQFGQTATKTVDEVRPFIIQSLL